MERLLMVRELPQGRKAHHTEVPLGLLGCGKPGASEALRLPSLRPLPFLLVYTVSFTVTFWKHELLCLADYHPGETVTPSPSFS